ncbi:tryptophan synthase subunit alpha [Paenibacillus sp. GSMTC-2017]|uniref:tryptophan synthase subunit alpha n=1 Tax=Paenibacillus sp. GSMTC-2017 TaxID=2794350 RepID=UPI0018D643AD|nr:tryptophan synthase subunit alpha [Paenibacillus sp. GSMTC-2017]MBH5317946.1 tryptophan synthase subunit alpha [Paenibacillus sp. GSMTC-2017]
MNLIDQSFARLKAEGKTALIPFITVGDPNLEGTLAIIKQLEKSGADMIELGVPYSDPLADGPVIQRASERALSGSTVTLLNCIEMAERAREAGVTIPLILFTYFNPVLQFGLEKFVTLVQSKGISGLIIPDLPIEEDEEVRALAESANVHLIPLVAPTSRDRVTRISQKARGFVYCVSSLGVTGVRTDFHSDIDSFLSTVREATDLPIGIGFGISSREQVKRFEGTCDAVIVGSAIVRQIEEAQVLLENPDTQEQGLEQIGKFVASLKG